MVAFAVDRTTGGAIDGVAVEVRAAGRVLGQATTDAAGLASLTGTFPATVELRAAAGDDLAMGSETYVPADVSTRRVYAFPHQPAYRPGERVEVKGLVRARRAGRYELDADVREVALLFRASSGQELGRTTAAVSSDMGTFVAGFDLAKDAPTGDATVVVDAGGKSYAAPFRIEAYRRPVFEVVVTSVVAAGRRGRAAGVRRRRVALRGRRRRRRLRRVDGHVLARRSRVVPDRRIGAPLLRHRARRLHAGDGRERDCDARRVGSSPRRDADPAPPEDGYLAIRAVVTGPDRTAVAGAGGAGYSAVPLTVALRTDKHLYGAEATARVTVKAQLADGRPAADRSGVLTVFFDAGARTDGIAEEHETHAVTFITTAEGTATLDVPFGENGRYRLAAALPRIAGEPAGAPASASLHVYVVGDQGRRRILGRSRRVGGRSRRLRDRRHGPHPRAWPPSEPDRCSRPIEASSLLLVSTPRLSDGPAGGAAVFEVKIGPDHSPNVYVAATLVDRGNVLAATKPAARAARSIDV